MTLRSALATILLGSATLIPSAPRAETSPVYCVLFTHIEDNTPAGTLGSAQSRQNYLLYRGRLIDMANLARDAGLPWSLQPDWKFLQAALLYEDSTLTPTTNGKNLMRYLKEDLDVVIDPHSHESFGYNYTDVAHLIDSLGVGATTVIGGHVWDPALPEFQEWDRYRVPVAGSHYPSALWRGDILMGSGTPHHVNDPVVSGVWRPRDRDHYFEHDSTANIAAIGQYKGTIEGILELVDLYQTGEVSPNYMLTASIPIRPATITSPGGIGAIEDSVIAPIVAMRDGGLIVPTDFTALIQTWQTLFDSRGYFFDAEATTGVGSDDPALPAAVSLDRCVPNPFAVETAVRFSVRRPTRVRLAIFDAAGREVALLVDEMMGPGQFRVPWRAEGLASGVYFCRLDRAREELGGGKSAPEAPGQGVGKLVLIR